MYRLVFVKLALSLLVLGADGSKSIKELPTHSLSNPTSTPSLITTPVKITGATTLSIINANPNITSLIFTIRFDVNLTIFDRRTVNVGICRLFRIIESSCSDAWFFNVKVWEGSVYYQFQFGGDLTSQVDKFAKYTQDDIEDIATVTGYPVIEAKSVDPNASDNSTAGSDSKLIGMPRNTGIGVLTVISAVIIIAIVVAVVFLVIKRRQVNDLRAYVRSRNESQADISVNRGNWHDNAPTTGRNPMFTGSEYSIAIPMTKVIPMTGTPGGPTRLQKGSRCMAKYSVDGRYYAAKIDDVNGDNFFVTYTAFGNGEWVSSRDIQQTTSAY